jgi:hypothetical protein
MHFDDVVSFKLVEDGLGLCSLRLQLANTPHSHLYEQRPDESRIVFVTRCFVKARAEAKRIHTAV